MTRVIIRYSVRIFGETMNSHKTFMDQLTISAALREAENEDEYDVIIAFVPIVSRVGTDISAAMNHIPEGKAVVLVVLHPTFNLDYIAPDSRLCVDQNKVFAVDCLFNEDQGLLKCLRNDDAIRAVKKHLNTEDNSGDLNNLLNFLWDPKHRKWIWVIGGFTFYMISLYFACKIFWSGQHCSGCICHLNNETKP